MANSGKNSNSSQFFFVLTDNAAQLAKLHGKYVCFGQVTPASFAVLDQINAAAATADGVPAQKVWVISCGLS